MTALPCSVTMLSLGLLNPWSSAPPWRQSLEPQLENILKLGPDESPW